MVLLICSIVMIICGLAFLIIPKDKLVNESKLKPGQTVESAAKNFRIYGIVFIVAGIMFLIFNM